MGSTGSPSNAASQARSDVEHDVRLAGLTTLRVGGPARTFIEVTDEDELISVTAQADASGEPLLLLSGGSNVVIGDDGFPGTVVRICTRGVEVTPDDDHVLLTLAAGESWDRLVARAASDAWSGIEALSGIPGSVGATPIQNVGAYGHEVAEVITAVTAYNRTTGRVEVLDAHACGFGYRSSRFKSEPGQWVILRVAFRLETSPLSAPIKYADLAERLRALPGDRVPAINVRRKVLDIRRAKGMVLDIDDHDTWSVGSFFTNPIVTSEQADALPPQAPRWPTSDSRVKISAAWLIDNSGFGRGWPNDPDADASLSTKHPLAVTNRGHAKTADILDVARSVRDGVQRAMGITLAPEPNLINCAL
ncbi:MAG: UDP-N-acetylmuramate dehydrogenase [Candidatus Nanopelagicales bacterium]